MDMTRSKVAYHYTAWSNWERIQRDGLVPYALEKQLGEGAKGIWMYPERLKGDEHVGSVLWQVCMKREMRIALLRCHYDPATLIGEPVAWNITHNGTLGNWKFHHDTPCVVVTKLIRPEDIELEGDYDLADATVAQGYALREA